MICKTCEIEYKGTVVNLLNQILADVFVLYVKVLNFHWNLTGVQFVHIHKFLGDLYTSMLTNIDDLAEHIRAMDGRPNATMAKFLGEAHNVTEEEPVDYDAENLLVILTKDFKNVNSYIRKVIEHITDNFMVDQATGFHGDSIVDFLTGLLQEFEKTTWQLSASVER